MNLVIWLGAAAAVLTGAGSVMEDPVKTKSIAPARDGNVAIEEELCAARKARTLAAYDLFLARHPDHPLATTAKAERLQIVRSARQD